MIQLTLLIIGLRLSNQLPSHLLYVARHLDKLDVSGDNRYAFNIMDGEYGVHNVSKIESRLKILAEIRKLMPNYLFEGAHG